MNQWNVICLSNALQYHQFHLYQQHWINELILLSTIRCSLLPPTLRSNCVCVCVYECAYVFICVGEKYSVKIFYFYWLLLLFSATARIKFKHWNVLWRARWMCFFLSLFPFCYFVFTNAKYRNTQNKYRYIKYNFISHFIV